MSDYINTEVLMYEMCSCFLSVYIGMNNFQVELFWEANNFYFKPLKNHFQPRIINELFF